MDGPSFLLDGEDVYGLKMDFYLASVFCVGCIFDHRSIISVSNIFKESPRPMISKFLLDVVLNHRFSLTRTFYLMSTLPLIKVMNNIYL